MTNSWTPQKAANRLSIILDKVAQANNIQRFPVNIKEIALESANIFGWDDPISKVQDAPLKSFEGALYMSENKKEWLLLYNSSLKSEGRILFTQGHELGHYILHRQDKDMFQCTPKDMLSWTNSETNIEAQADLFSSYLLMPLNDYREQLTDKVDIECLSRCASRYGVSLVAAILKWLEFTEESAVLIISKDGFIDWACSSTNAMKAGAFFKSKTQTIPLPNGSIALEPHIVQERNGIRLPATTWFKNANKDAYLSEMKVQSDYYNCIISLLILPKYENFWESRYT